MFLIHVIPISRGITKDRLSYFSKKNVEKGALVSVPLRGKLTPAIAISSESVRDVKTRLRQSPYPIKKLEHVHAGQLFSPAFMAAIENMATYSAASIGATISTLVPRAILDDPQERPAAEEADSDKDLSYERLVLQMDRDERFATYRGIIREAFARKQSVFICMPTLHDVERFTLQSEKGIRAYLFTFHSGLTKKQVKDRWQKALNETHPVVIVGTGSFLSISRKDIQTIIVERESASAYKSSVRPYIDVRTFADLFARELGARVIFADSFLRIETLHRYYRGEAAELAPLRFRPLSPATQKVIDMKNHTPSTKGQYDIIGSALALLVEETKRSAAHLFIYSARRGLSPITVCSDCGATVTSTYSDAPMVLHKTSRGNIFFCHQNGEVRSAAERCRNCGGWKLVALGAGVQLVEEQLKARFPEYSFFRIDSDTTNTHKRARAVVDAWRDTPGSVLIGTEMALSYINEPVEHVAVASMDSLLAIPDFKIESKVLSILLTLRALAQQTFLLQTRNPDQQILKDATSGNLLDFYRREIKVRESLGYPPFATFIKLTVSGKKEAVAKEMEQLEETFNDLDLRVFSAFTPAPYGKQTSHAIIRIPADKWPDEKIAARLRALPPYIAVAVDPESVL